MIDFHSHILPGIDDGSRSIDMSRTLLERSGQIGVDRMIATPHFYAQRETFDLFFEKRGAALEQILRVKNEWQQIPVLHVGAEVYFFPGIGRADRLRELCVQGTDILLLEMPFEQWNRDVVSEVREIIEKQKLRIIIAHAERYYGFQKNMSFWDEIMEMPVTVQLNTGTFSDFWKKKFCFKMLKERELILLGSDCHNPDARPQNLDSGREVILKKFGQQMLDHIDREGETFLDAAGAAERY